MNRFHLARAPIPAQFIRQRKQGNAEVDYLSWADTADAMDAAFGPENWEFKVDDVRLTPMGIVQVDGKDATQHHICVTVTVTVATEDGRVSRSNTGEDILIEVFRTSTRVNDKGVLSATHNAFKRACAMFGVARGLYLRDPNEGGAPALLTLSELLAMRRSVYLTCTKLKERIAQAVEDGIIKESRGAKFVEDLNDALADPFPKGKAVGLETITQVIERIEQALQPEATKET